jgi:hypothetical protein
LRRFNCHEPVPERSIISSHKGHNFRVQPILRGNLGIVSDVVGRLPSVMPTDLLIAAGLISGPEIHIYQQMNVGRWANGVRFGWLWTRESPFDPLKAYLGWLALLGVGPRKAAQAYWPCHHLLRQNAVPSNSLFPNHRQAGI